MTNRSDTDINETTSLLTVTHYGTEDDLRRLLCSGHCDVTEVCASSGTSALHVAAERGRVEMLELLLSYGADVDISTLGYEITALFSAILPHQSCPSKDILTITRMLIQAGCDVDHQDGLGRTALQIAVDRQLGWTALMLLAGDCAVPSDFWLTSEMDIYLTSIESQCPELYTEYLTSLHEPRSLQRLCRIVLRDDLAWGPGCWPYRDRVKALPLPKSLQDFLLYRELDDIRP